MRFTTQTHALRTGLRLLVPHALGLPQHLLHLDKFGRLGVAVAPDFQELLLPLSELAVKLTRVEF